MVKEKATGGINVTMADDVLCSALSNPDKVEPIITSAEEILAKDCFNIDKMIYEPTTEASDIIAKMDDKHAWAIFLDKKLIQELITSDGHTQHFLIGYENGISAKRNETHFSQKENDPISHRLIFQPEPTFISYSFFYGFFGQTIETLCQKYFSSNTEWNISIRHKILKDFKDKYTFSFPKRPEMERLMFEYAETLIENIIDIQAKVGK